MRLVLALFLMVPVLGACNKNTDPATAGYWLDRLEDKQQRINALKELGKIGDKAAVPKVLEWFEKEGEWQPDAAYTLGQLGDQSVVQNLVAGLDFQVGTGSDKVSRNKNRTNINIMRALAMLGAKDTADRVLRLADAAEATVREAAIKTLGRLGNPVATEKLMDIARNDREPFLRKTAIQALGDLGDPKAVPALIEMLYVEMPNVSFYNEARFSLIEIGPAATPDLVKTLQRENETVEAIRMANGDPIGEGAIEAKVASVLGYLQATGAESEILDAMNGLYGKFQKRDSMPVFASVPGAIIEMCYALGNLGTPNAARMLTTLASDTDPNIRLAATEALTQIGDRGATKTLLAAARNGDALARRAALVAASRLGTGADLDAFNALAKAGDKEVSAEIMAKLVEAERPRLEAAKECGTDQACWRKKLDDKNAKVRDKAVWELGWLAGEDAMAELLKASEDNDPTVRMAAVLSMSRIGGADVGKLEQIYEKWEKKLDYQGVNQELRRVIARMKSQTRTAQPEQAKK